MRKYIIALIILGSIEISLALWLTFWREAFWNDIAVKNVDGFLVQLSYFTVAAIVICLVSAWSSYILSLSTIEWRKRLNKKAFDVREQKNEIENVEQRVQQDCQEFPSLVLTLTYGFIKAIVYLFVFSYTLIMEFSYIYLLILSFYALISTWMAKYIANPLISLNYQSQRLEATYRKNLTPVNFELCIINMFGLAKKTKHLQYFQVFYGQLGVIIPVLIIAPEYFSTALLIGGLMQATSIMQTILENLSYGINSFDSINRLISSKKRLVEIGVIK